MVVVGVNNIAKFLLQVFIILCLQLINFDLAFLQLLSEGLLHGVVLEGFLHLLWKVPRHQEVALDKILHFDKVFDEGVERFGALADTITVIKAEVPRRIQRDLFKLKFCGLVIQFLLKVIHHLNTIHHLALAVLARMDVEVVVDDALSVEAGLEDLLLEVVAQVQHLGDEVVAVWGVVGGVRGVLVEGRLHLNSLVAQI